MPPKKIKLKNCLGLSILFFDSCVCVSWCLRQRDIHGTSISSLMYCKYYLFCAAYININIWISEYPTHRPGLDRPATTPHRALSWISDLRSGPNVSSSPRLPGDDGTKRFCILLPVTTFSDCQTQRFRSRRGLDYLPFFIWRMIDRAIKPVYCCSHKGEAGRQAACAVETRECLCQAIINIQQTLGTIWEGDYIGLRFNELIIDVTLLCNKY